MTKNHQVNTTRRSHVSQTTWREVHGISYPSFVDVPLGPAISYDGKTYIPLPLVINVTYSV